MLATKLSPGYGLGEHTMELGLEEQLLLEPGILVAFLRETFSAPGYKPPLLPAVAIRVLDLARNPLVGFDEVLSLLESDPLLAGEILRIAQSPVYATSEPAHSLAQALSRLGLATLSDICLQAAMNTRVFRAEGFTAPMTRLREHSTAVAHVARLVCRHTSLFDDQAFLAGLLHDAGVAAALITLAERGKRGRIPDFQLIWGAVREVHAACTGQLVKLWQLPPDLVLALAHHHDVTIGGRVHPLSAALAVADALVCNLGFDLGESSSESEARVAAEALGLGAPTLRNLRREAEDLLARIAA